MQQPNSHIELKLGGERSYYLDAASATAAHILLAALHGKAAGESHADTPLTSEPKRLLDLCAAPGGKSLVLAAHMGEDALLTANERSATRRARLKTVLDEHLPTAVRSRIHVTGHDATKWCLYEKDAYDAILLDAPCSSERHLLQHPVHLTDWSIKRSKQLAQRQYAMLASALDVVKPGGFILYSTCAINPLENDGVIERLLGKRKGRVHVCPLPDATSSAPNDVEREPTVHGAITLPDTMNHGPLYICLLQRADIS
jgi:16S rRNA C967 or C1407 C5-methylase (RsmB/RsmF family)